MGVTGNKASLRRVALVPGATGGLGQAVAEALARLDVDLFLGYQSNAEVAQTLARRLASTGRDIAVEQLEARSPAGIREWTAAALARFGRIDILANCLGYGDQGGFKNFIDQDEAIWMSVLEIELLATLRFAQCVVPSMIAQGWGRIITLGSDSAKVGEGGAAANAAARGGCLAFSKSLAREVGRHGITVNMVCPGPIDTPLLKRLAEREEGKGKITRMQSMTALKRFGTPREVADALAFLASDAASYVTGQAISVSGGLTMC